MFEFLKRKNQDPKFELRKVLGRYDLPSFPAVLTRILEKLRDQQASATDCAGLIAADPGLSVKILRTVNCAAYSPRTKILSLDQAVVMLGRSNLELLVMSVAVRDALPSEPCRGFLPKRFWKTASRRAATARALAKVLHPATMSECFTASLLQDMAVPLIAQHKPAEYGKLLESWHQGSAHLYELEQRSFGWDHAQVGTWVSSEWELPESIGAAIGGHHGANGQGMVCPPAVHLVSHLRESDERTGVEALVEAAATRHGLPAEKTEALVKESFEAAEELEALFR